MSTAKGSEIKLNDVLHNLSVIFAELAQDGITRASRTSNRDAMRAQSITRRGAERAEHFFVVHSFAHIPRT